jgi:hypothetical protein
LIRIARAGSLVNQPSRRARQKLTCTALSRGLARLGLSLGLCQALADRNEQGRLPFRHLTDPQRGRRNRALERPRPKGAAEDAFSRRALLWRQRPAL